MSVQRMGDSYHDSKDGIFKQMVKEMLDREDCGLTDWEIQFLNSVSKRSHTTDKQRDIIEKIYKEIM